jgi:acetyltransferase-like isoleucine patch superfamily enzyme
MVAIGGKCSIGKNFSMNNGIKGNPIGCYDRCTFFVNKGAILEIGDNVGISQTALICHKHIKICNNVKIGGGVKIYDTDFHSLDPSIRANKTKDLQNKIAKEIIIGDNVFIGAYSIILKGVVIGNNSIVGAGSVVTKSIPANQIWAGNPAKFIKMI